MAEESSRRVQRVEKQIREILGTHLIREFQHHVEGLITISNVRISPDLKHGRIYLRVLGPTFAQSKIQRLELFDELKERHGEIQRFLGKSLDTKFIPKLEFFYDETLEEALKVEQTLRRLADERKTIGIDDGVIGIVHPENVPVEAPDFKSRKFKNERAHGEDAESSGGRLSKAGSSKNDRKSKSERSAKAERGGSKVRESSSRLNKAADEDDGRDD